ncbi:MAG: aminomethyl-transferring glycine dehydrogenase [Alphaproteobacteria bacterium]|nr:aminomethyl-transferring glycine dehydrogenase [Alphaproteobacteria bacterium]
MPSLKEALNHHAVETASQAISDPHEFLYRHIGPRSDDIQLMLKEFGVNSLDDFMRDTVPNSIVDDQDLLLPPTLNEYEVLEALDKKARQNDIFKSYIGMGFHDCLIPPVTRRLILENPSWYTAYTPYQAEISQGRLEMLLNFQQMIMDLTGFEIANASLLDEASACAESMTFLKRISTNDSLDFLIDEHVHPQNIAVLQTRAKPLGINITIGKASYEIEKKDFFGVLLQYPTTLGEIIDYRAFISKAHESNTLVAMSCDLLALTILTPPAELGADVAIGTTQRFGMPLGFGGPHAAYFATKDAYKRNIPGRLIGVSVDTHGNKALRMALQTREQHIRREKATSNVCTAQALPAIMASAYAIYMGPQGLKNLALQLHAYAQFLATTLTENGYHVQKEHFFDTILVNAGGKINDIKLEAHKKHINFRYYDHRRIVIALNETTNAQDLIDILSVFSIKADLDQIDFALPSIFDEGLRRKTTYLTHAVFQLYHSETEFMRYIKHLEDKDLALNRAMIPLGSCTMKLNSATELTPITFKGFAHIHPFAPIDQTKGYQALCRDLESYLAEITGFDAVSLQPNAGSQGEFAGLLAIHHYHQSRHEGHRHICLIPASAHGTNPASAKMVGYDIIQVPCDSNGNVDILSLKNLAHIHAKDLAAFMITYPSTHGVFEGQIRKMIDIIHENGGQVYIDGANLNALVGIAKFGELGGDVCHINLHKTFCIPHGGGGPGMGPIAVKSHLKPFLPQMDLSENAHMVSSAFYGSALILPISWAYIRLMGSKGLKFATQIALLNANYIAQKLSPYYPILYTGLNNRVAHECILDLRPLRDKTGISVDDIAKRLVDYGFHAPTVSFPVAGTLMIEPTESESKVEIDRFIEAMILIHAEIQDVFDGRSDPENNPLKRAPHIIQDLMNDWDRPYSKEKAFFPSASTKQRKYWSPVGRVNHDYGDRNLFCGCS